MMTWGWDSITFLGASLFVTVYATVRIVEARHVAVIVLDQAFSTRPYHPKPPRRTVVGVEPETPVVETVRKPRHYLENESEEPPDDTYSARAILARCGIELADVDSGSDFVNSDNDTDRLMIIHTDRFDRIVWPVETDRLFTHGYEAHR